MTLRRTLRLWMTCVAALTTTVVGIGVSDDIAQAATYPGCNFNSTLRHFHRGDNVNCLEKALRSKGYMNRWVNTYYGTATVAAVARFQRDNGLRVTGVVDGQTATLLGVWRRTTTSTSSSTSKNCEISRTLRTGARGSDVACYEAFLRKKKWQSKYVDNYYGTHTAAYGTKAAERSLGLPADGIADPWLLYKLGLWSGKKPSKPRTWNGKDGDCGLYPTGDAVLVNRASQRLWRCRNGARYGGLMPFTAGPIYNAPKGEYRVFFKNHPWWGGNYRLDNFTAFTRGVNGGRVGFHKYVIMRESQVGSEAWRNRSGGCIRMRAADAKKIYDFLGYGEVVRVLNNA